MPEYSLINTGNVHASFSFCKFNYAGIRGHKLKFFPWLKIHSLDSSRLIHYYVEKYT